MEGSGFTVWAFLGLGVGLRLGRDVGVRARIARGDVIL